MQKPTISQSIRYIGVDDLDIDLFEHQYEVPEGMSYNSYVILDEKVAVMDTVDARKTDEWEANLKAALGDRKPDYLVAHHMEPDHAANIARFVSMYPEAKVLCSAKASQMLGQFFDEDLSANVQVVKEGDVVSLGTHSLQFIAAPMVHWPEVLMSYEASEKVLFAADGFGKFGAIEKEPAETNAAGEELNEKAEWACEARRYYFNICGKYGAQVQAVLKKAAALDIKTICPLHGPVLKEDLGHYIGLYDTWSKYEPETIGVFIAHTTLHGNTAKAAEILKEKLEAKGVKVAMNDLTHDDMAEGIEDAFRYDRMVLCAPTYDAGIMPKMEDFLAHLKSKGYKNRTVGLIENGSWAPAAAKLMRAKLEELSNVKVLDEQVSIRSTVKPETIGQIEKLADALTA
ncbi:MAG: FprA family A-type flavoprotein [Bacteroidaceae bacterium]|nr:FprA family A-type flavoprotein [Bacteroidaceae bacterium]